MDLSDLRAFLVVAHAGTLAEAGRAIHSTPSALSKAVRRLETRLGVELFHRDGLRLRLNEAGERLVPRARSLVDAADALRSDFDTRSRPISASIAGPAVLQWAVAPAVCEAFAAVAPQGRLAFRTLYEDAALAALRAGDVDLALVTAEALDDVPASLVGRRLLGRYRMALTEGADATAARIACTSTSPVCGRMRSMQDPDWLSAQGVGEPTYRVDDMLVLLRLVESGHAKAFVPEFLLERFGLVAPGSAAQGEYEDVFLAWREPAVRWVRDLSGGLGKPAFT